MTQNNAIPDEVRRFIANLIPSVPHLEALLLLRSQPEEPWSLAELANRLYISEKKARELASDLVSMGVIGASTSAQPGFTYAPSSPSLSATIDQLAAIYASRLVEVTHLIHSKTNRKAQQFADAFKWSEDK